MLKIEFIFDAGRSFQTIGTLATTLSYLCSFLQDSEISGPESEMPMGGLIFGVRFWGEWGRRRQTVTVYLSLYAQVLCCFDADPGCVRSAGCGGLQAGT